MKRQPDTMRKTTSDKQQDICNKQLPNYGTTNQIENIFKRIWSVISSEIMLVKTLRDTRRTIINHPVYTNNNSNNEHYITIHNDLLKLSYTGAQRRS
jgi:hypothetical protein